MNTKKDRYYYKLKEGINPVEGSDGIFYREPILIIVNFILKLVQPFTDKPFLLCSSTQKDDNGNPHFDGYSFRRVKVFDGYFMRLKSSIVSKNLVVKFYEH